MGNDIQQLIKIIDSRVESKLNKTITKFPAKVVSVLSASQSIVKLSNDEKEITFLNKTGEVLSVGDSVFIETIDGDLTGGFISERFGVPVLAGGGEGGSMTALEILTSLKTVDGTSSGLDADLIDGQHGSYYLNRENHTGTQSADSITDGTANKVYTATEKTKLEGIANGATANDTDENLKNRANHTGTQAATTVTITDTGNHFTATEVEGALSELFTSVSDGKTLLADTITDEGVTTSATPTFADLNTNIQLIKNTPYNKLAVKCSFEGTTATEIGINAIIKSGTPSIIYDSNGKFGQCYSATNATRIYINYSADTFSSDFTVSLWFKTSTTSGYRRLFYYYDNSRLLSIELGNTDNKIKITANGVGGAALLSSTSTYNNGLWHLLIFRKSGTNISTLIDNTENLTSSTTLTGTITTPLSVSDTAYYLNGYIDNFCAWRYSISDNDCTWLWNNGNGRA